jgi:outer membrane protein insertion porin family
LKVKKEKILSKQILHREMTKAYKQHIISLFMLVNLCACTGIKHLTEGEYLARSGGVKIVEKESIKEFNKIRIGLSKLAEIKHNNKLLWMRPRLSIYNSIKEVKKNKGFKNWYKNSLGKAPVYYNESGAERARIAMEEYLFNNGYFNSQVSLECLEKKFQKKSLYSVHTGLSYKVNELSYVSSGKVIDSEIQSIINTYTKQLTGEPYSLEKLIDQRKEMAYYLMNKGYYYFRPDYLEFIADTVNISPIVNLTIQLKSNTPSNAFNQYWINTVTVEDKFYPDSTYKVDTHLVNNVYYFSPILYINPKVVINAVHIQPDSLYNRDAHLRTLNHLRALQVYKFVSIVYNQDDSLIDRLNSHLFLVPLSKMSFSGELNANIKSNNFAGPGILFSFTNRNSFKGAEVLEINFGGRFETQVGQDFSNNTSYEIRLDGGLQIPRLYPFKNKRIKNQYLPTTSVNIGGGLQERITWYQMATYSTTLRYNWRQSDKISHRISPIDINLSNLLKTTQQFDDYLSANPSVKRSFEEQFVLGMNYDFFFSKTSDKLSTPFLFGLTLDFSGNLITGLIRLTGKEAPEPDNPYLLFNTPYSQFIRSIIDVRKRFDLWPKNSIATRLLLSGGVPYGNSSTLPYIKQYYVGGANSLRGFQSRSVGPGTYQNDDENTVYIDQAGDLKLEMNVEYRFPIWGMLQSAFFIDAGNIWLVNEDESRQGGKFEINSFIDQLAVSTGIGVRFEINPIIIRFDWAWPIRYPYKTDGSNWVVDKIDFTNHNWRKENVILNISLGYPF